jgi:hypothetical protein
MRVRRHHVESVSWIAGILGALATVAIYIESHRTPVDEIPTIAGAWDREHALHLIAPALNDEFEARPSQYCKAGSSCHMAHEFIGEYSAMYIHNECLVLLMSTSDPKLQCHACTAYLSAFEFCKVKRGWNLRSSDIAALRCG